MERINCALDEGSSGASSHKPGVLSVTAKSPMGSNLRVRVCVDCVDELCTQMRGDGYTSIKITAPEQPAYTSWRAQQASPRDALLTKIDPVLLSITGEQPVNVTFTATELAYLASAINAYSFQASSTRTRDVRVPICSKLQNALLGREQ